MNRTPEITKEQYDLLCHMAEGNTLDTESATRKLRYTDAKGIWHSLYHVQGGSSYVSLDLAGVFAMDLYETRLLLKRLLHG